MFADESICYITFKNPWCWQGSAKTNGIRNERTCLVTTQEATNCAPKV